MLSQERYASADTLGDVARYDRTMESFYVSQNMQPTRWSAHSLARLRSRADLKGRHRLVKALRAQGIGLL